MQQKKQKEEEAVQEIDPNLVELGTPAEGPKLSEYYIHRM